MNQILLLNPPNHLRLNFFGELDPPLGVTGTPRLAGFLFLFFFLLFRFFFFLLPVLVFEMFIELSLDELSSSAGCSGFSICSNWLAVIESLLGAVTSSNADSFKDSFSGLDVSSAFTCSFWSKSYVKQGQRDCYLSWLIHRDLSPLLLYIPWL